MKKEDPKEPVGDGQTTGRTGATDGFVPRRRLVLDALLAPSVVAKGVRRDGIATTDSTAPPPLSARVPGVDTRPGESLARLSVGFRPVQNNTE